MERIYLIKQNAVELTKIELVKIINKTKLSGSTKYPTIAISSVTDAWQHIEDKIQITRKILKILVEYNYLGLIILLTRSPLIL